MASKAERDVAAREAEIRRLVEAGVIRPPRRVPMNPEAPVRAVVDAAGWCTRHGKQRARLGNVWVCFPCRVEERTARVAPARSARED